MGWFGQTTSTKESHANVPLKRPLCGLSHLMYSYIHRSRGGGTYLLSGAANIGYQISEKKLSLTFDKISD
jgi:hypothetical protein